jgi:hypothetical protein
MRTIAMLLTCLTVLAVAGCEDDKAITAATGSAVERSVACGGLSVGIGLPARTFKVGEVFTVKVVAENTSKKPIRITAPTNTPVVVRIWRNTGAAWDEVLRFPKNDMMVTRVWTLAPGATREFSLRLRVEPTWPVGELLRLSGNLHGRPDVMSDVTFDVER